MTFGESFPNVYHDNRNKVGVVTKNARCELLYFKNPILQILESPMSKYVDWVGFKCMNLQQQNVETKFWLGNQVGNFLELIGLASYLTFGA